MERTLSTWSIEELSENFYEIEFPEYQREPDIWTREQKQRLIDSILRQFDIASIYVYKRSDGGLECIDGRQRLNAIMSFLGQNPLDDADNGFALRIQNEISANLPSRFAPFDGHTFEQLQEGDSSLGQEAVASLLNYRMTVIFLSGAAEPDEFNLQFLRLNLGTLINAGEKLHAMVGSMRDLIFSSERMGLHPFFDLVRIPTRRYAKEQVAAQVLLQVFAKRETGHFSRARHFDLQRFVKMHAEVGEDHPWVLEVQDTLDALHGGLGDVSTRLRNRAMTLSVVLLAWERSLSAQPDVIPDFGEFLEAFVGRLQWQVRNMREFNVDDRYGHLVEFQRHLTQAAVERPAVTRRHELLVQEWTLWRQDGVLTGDVEYESQTGNDPPTA